MSRISFGSVVATILICSAATSAVAADIVAGAQTAKQVCQACHGLDGNSASQDFPKLGGQHADYLNKTLRDYKSGRRKNAIMAGFASGLSPRDIENVSAYYASQPAVVVVKQ